MMIAARLRARTGRTKAMALDKPWWTWQWDKSVAENVSLPFERITRWRRGSFLTVYRMQTVTEVGWWLVGPFNIQIGLSIPKRLTWSGMPPKADS